MAHTFEQSVAVRVAPDELYDLVCDVTRTGEWSPICTGCEWDDTDRPGIDGPHGGAHFTGHNQTPQRTWSTRGEITAADRGREFGWKIGEDWSRWHFSFAPVDGGTELTESWNFTDAGLAKFAELYGEQADAQIANRIEAAHTGIPATLAAIKKIAESG